jgi:hypothetical protein
MHYHTAGVEPGAVDQSSVLLQLADDVEREALFSPWLDPSWPLGEMPIPAGSADTAHSYKKDPRPFFELVSPDLKLDNGFHMFGVFFHMHRIGRTGKVLLHKKSGQQVLLLNIENWDFDWQLDYRFQEPVRVEPGEQLEVRCSWDASSRSVDTNWGDGSDDEMCVANVLIAP